MATKRRPPKLTARHLLSMADRFANAAEDARKLAAWLRENPVSPSRPAASNPDKK